MLTTSPKTPRVTSAVPAPGPRTMSGVDSISAEYRIDCLLDDVIRASSPREGLQTQVRRKFVLGSIAAAIDAAERPWDAKSASELLRLRGDDVVEFRQAREVFRGAQSSNSAGTRLVTRTSSSERFRPDSAMTTFSWPNAKHGDLVAVGFGEPGLLRREHHRAERLGGVPGVEEESTWCR